MNAFEIVCVVVGAMLLGVVMHLFATAYAARCVYVATLMRKNKEQWSRKPSDSGELFMKMDKLGTDWSAEHKANKEDVHICNKGLNLYGEYYNFGCDRTVIVLSGRTESLRYGYFFGIPYYNNGFNVLVVDPRAHGESDGVYNTVGFEEGNDALEWARFINREYGVDNIVYHGICIGAAAGMYAITSDDCPDYIRGLVTEGMFANFGHSMRNHLIERKKNIFPIMSFIDMQMKMRTGHSMMKGPIDVIHKMKKPLLMLQSLEDIYSTPDNAKIMFDICPSSQKTLVLFEKGSHSMLRITDTEKYDNAIKNFVN